MSIVTKTGDTGTTSLMYNRRVSKSNLRVEAYGTVDELNAALGLARATSSDPWIREQLALIQQHLVILMGELATDPEDRARYLESGFHSVSAEFTTRLESLVGFLEREGVQIQGWATPGETLDAAALDLARTVCRRAERRICALEEGGQLGNREVLVYLNRLSDLLWLVARRAERGRSDAKA